MARTRTYNHFCPVARPLEVICEKWSLLIVRDLLRGPQRFTDLLRGLNNITPKWLTLRLRELEAAGIVERDQEPGRKEVRYRLTEKGAQLGPVIAALNVWGVDHAMRPPEPGEGILLARSLQAIASYFNSRGLKAEAPLEWEIRTPDNPPARIRFDGETWRLRGEDPSPAPALVVESDAQAWAEFLAARGEDRAGVFARMRVVGGDAAVAFFRQAFRIPAGA